MESWLQRLLLATALSISLPLMAQDENSENASEEDNRTILDGVINPDIKRRKINESLIDTEDFEMGFFAGVMSIEDFGTNNVYGMRVGYKVSEDWFLEANYGATRTGRTSFEVLGGSSELLTDDERNLTYYNLSLGLNLLPGESFLGDSFSLNTKYYVLVGLGNTQFAGDEFFTINYGAGLKILPFDWVAIQIGFHNHLFTHSIFGVDKAAQNLESKLGLSLYF